MVIIYRHTTETEETNILKVKNPNWQEADRLAIYNRSRGFEIGTFQEQIQLVAGWRS